MRNSGCFSSLLIAALALSTSAQAICSRPEPKLCSEFFTHELVIRAKVLKIEPVIHPNDPTGVDGWIYHLDVIKTYRDPTFKRQTINSDNTSARLLLTQGKEYVIFADKNSDGLYEAGGNCAGIQPLTGELYSSKLDSAITALNKTRKASIEIEFRDRRDQPAPFPGVAISSTAGICP
jgi:hypothetical protein